MSKSQDSIFALMSPKKFLSSRSDCWYNVRGVEVNILDDPYEFLLTKHNDLQDINRETDNIVDYIILPLYSDRTGNVEEKSGLNQWNAKGRKRDKNEVYIPIPAIIHKKYPDFFPARDKPFDLRLPNGKIMKSKICQDGGKALMSYSNKELGEWILREVLKLDYGELLTYEKLQILGIDSVRIDKIDDTNFEINFSSNGSFENFIEN